MEQERAKCSRSVLTRISVLEMARSGDSQAWTTISELYRPLIRYWVLRRGISAEDAEDIVQDTLITLYKGLESFQHGGRNGSFRAWLRKITICRAQDYYRSNKRNVMAASCGFEEWLNHLQDSSDELSLLWDQQHDEYILKSLLALIELEFEPTTVQIFKRVSLEGCDAAEIAQEFGTTVGAIYTSRSRILQRIRRMAQGLLDIE